MSHEGHDKAYGRCTDGDGCVFVRFGVANRAFVSRRSTTVRFLCLSEIPRDPLSVANCDHRAESLFVDRLGDRSGCSITENSQEDVLLKTA